jgi:16S rRNA (guanine966-N2)-methyltransferase
LRIISGIAGGLQLSTPPGKSRAIRPTSDKGREALFSILGRQVVGAKVLDLYAGTGALGLEALSRGAASALFIDNSKTALTLLNKNIAIFERCIGRTNTAMPTAKVIKANLEKGLPSLITEYSAHRYVFDILLMDPPYDTGLALTTLHHLDSLETFSPDCLVVVEERASVNLPETLTQLQCSDTRRYGDTAFWFYQPR